MGVIRGQRSFYDHVLRPNERPGDVIGYIAANPVQSGLVEDYCD